MKRVFWGVCAILGCVLWANIACAEDINSKLLADIEEYKNAGNHTSREMGESIVERLEKNPAGITAALIERLKAAGGNEKSLSIYIWAIGWTRDANATDELIKAANASESPTVRGNAYQSLAKIGGKKAGKYLLSKAKEALDSDNLIMELAGPLKFDILNCLAEMQYEPALEEMQGLLKKDYNKYYWQQLFCFGKMGDKAVPFLLKKINDKDRNTRYAATALLGQILIAPEAAKPLSERYWKEQDSEIKQLLLSSLEKITCDLNEMESFFNQVAAKEQNQDAKKFAEETVAGVSAYRTKVKEEKAKKKDNRDLYQKEYMRIYKDYGHIGNIDTLANCSSSKDEPDLKKLRERVLLRNSDECFYDYDRINSVIMFNRMIDKN